MQNEQFYAYLYNDINMDHMVIITNQIFKGLAACEGMYLHKPSLIPSSSQPAGPTNFKI